MDEEVSLKKCWCLKQGTFESPVCHPTQCPYRLQYASFMGELESSGLLESELEEEKAAAQPTKQEPPASTPSQQESSQPAEAPQASASTATGTSPISTALPSSANIESCKSHSPFSGTEPKEDMDKSTPFTRGQHQWQNAGNDRLWDEIEWAVQSRQSSGCWVTWRARRGGRR